MNVTQGMYMFTDLQESGDGLFVVGPHGHHVLIEPEERSLTSPTEPDIAQDAEELKEQSPSPLCMMEDHTPQVSVIV